MRAFRLYILAWPLAGLIWAAQTPLAAAQALPVSELGQALQDQGWPPEATSRLLALAYDAGRDRAATARLLEGIRALGAMGFPGQALRAKMDEGRAKRIPAPRIVAALETRVEHGRFVMGLPQAAAAGRSAAEVEALGMLVDSLEIGLLPEDLERLSQAGGSLAQLAVAAEMSAMLRQMDFDPDLAARIVDTGLASGALDREWRSLPQIAALARRRGLTDGEVAQAVLKNLAAGATPRDLLPDLGFTGRDLQRGPMNP